MNPCPGCKQVPYRVITIPHPLDNFISLSKNATTLTEHSTWFTASEQIRDCSKAAAEWHFESKEKKENEVLMIYAILEVTTEPLAREMNTFWVAQIFENILKCIFSQLV